MSIDAYVDSARDQWAEAYKNSEFYKGSSNGQHYGACPHCGGDDRFWIHFSGKHSSTFSCRGCEPKKGTTQAATIARALNDLAGVRLTTSKWKILRTHEYRTSKGTVRHMKGIPPNETRAKPFWRHWDGTKWQKGIGPDVKVRDLLWNHWTVKPEHKTCVICEGEKDASMMYELLGSEMLDTCFVSGAGGATTAAMNLSPLSQIKTFYVLFDADPAGRKGALKYAAYIKNCRPDAEVFYYAPPGNSKRDWGDIIEEAQEAESVRSDVIARVTETLVETMTKATLFSADAYPSPVNVPTNGAISGEVLQIEEFDDLTIPMGWTDAEIAAWILKEKLGAQIKKGLCIDAPVIYDESRAEWYFCWGGVWKPIDFPKMVAGFMEEAREVVASKWGDDTEKLFKVLASNVKRDQVLKIIQRYVNERGENIFDQSPWLVCGSPPDFSRRAILEDPSGKNVSRPAQVWDLRTGELRSAELRDYIRSTLGTPLPDQPLVDSMEVDADTLGMHIAKDCPGFWQLISQISSYIPNGDVLGAKPESDHSWMIHMCEWIGQCLTADITPEKFLFFKGDGSNGKGLLAEILLELTGSLGHVAPDGLFNPRRTAHRQEQAILEGKHLLVVDEQKAHIDTGLLKSWTGGMPITADHKGGKSITFPVTFTVILLSNEMPRFPSANASMQRRLVGVPFDMLFDGEKGHFPIRAKEDIFQEIRREFPKLAYLCLAMYRGVKLRGNQFTPCGRVDAKSTELLLSMNRVQEWIETCLHVGPEFPGVSTKDMYTSYKAFMKENAYRPVLQSKSFTSEVRSVTLQKRLDMVYTAVGPREKRARGFRGCALKAIGGDDLMGNH